MTSEAKLIARYEKAEKELLDTIINKEARGNVTAYHRSLLRQIQQVLAKLRKDTPALVNAVVEDGYRVGLSQSMADSSTVFSILDERQVALLELNTEADLLNGVNLVGRHIEGALRAAAVEATAQKITTGQTVRDLKKNLLLSLTGASDEALVSVDGQMGVRYRDGRIVSLSKYTAMVARTTTAEAATRADLQRGEQWGFDLAICTSHAPTCEICSKYAGRVYATTREAANGKYYGLRFPYLYDTALNRGYQVIHPSCKHSFTSISGYAYTEAELTEMSRRSMQPFEDTRSDAERKDYAEKQANNRRRRSDEILYDRVRAVLPDDAYKSFGAFRNAKSANSERYRDLMKDYRYVVKAAEINNGVVGVITSTGVQINSASKHFIERAIERKISSQNATEALTSPLYVDNIKADERGLSQKFIGSNVTAAINPDTGNLITAHRTSEKARKKHGGE